MATKLPAVQYHPATMFFPSLTYSRSRFLFESYFQKTAFGYNNGFYPRLCFFYIAVPSVNNSRQMKWSLNSTVDGSSGSDPSEGSTSSGTRLIRALRSFQTKLSTRIKDLRTGLPMKILFFLVGFYCATAFATVIGQTGDWDILSAGLAVVVVEAIGALMYRASFRFLDKVRNLITVFNYWKAGLSMGLFLDSFKYEMDNFLDACKPFGVDINVFPIFW